MLKPRALRSGDRIGVVAPASPFRPEELEAALTLPLGVRARVVASGTPELVVEESAVTEDRR